MNSGHSRKLLSLAVLILCSCAARREAPQNTPEGQYTFASAEDAADALKTAVAGRDRQELLHIFGANAGELLSSGDDDADKERAAFIAARMAERTEVVQVGGGLEGQPAAVLIIGEARWPLPIPLVVERGRWRFDTALGRQEILNRRIGANELMVLALCRDYVRAQREYAEAGYNGGAYADRFFSTPGKKDGLFWEPRAGQPRSPIGPFAAKAADEAYVRTAFGAAAPYHGYYYRILTRQGPNARFGAKNYITQGGLRGGFALLAYPAKWDESGAMTFITGPDGIIYEKNLGRETPQIAAKIASFDPDASWRPAIGE